MVSALMVYGHVKIDKVTDQHYKGPEINCHNVADALSLRRKVCKG